MPARVLAGVDGSEDATFAVETLLAFADPERVFVKVVCVEDVPTPASTLRQPFGGSAPATPEVLRKLKEVTWGVAEHAAERLGAAGLQAEPAVVPGAPAACLLQEAESDMADLVVVGSRGLGPVSRMLVGSVSDRIARNARAALVCRRHP